MKQYTRKQLKEYARLGLARDLTTVDPDTLPKWYEKSELAGVFMA